MTPEFLRGTSLENRFVYHTDERGRRHLFSRLRAVDIDLYQELEMLVRRKSENGDFETVFIGHARDAKLFVSAIMQETQIFACFQRQSANLPITSSLDCEKIAA